MKKIDVFDFDKTLYKKDSTVQFYLFCLKKHKHLIKYLPMQIIFIILFKLTKKDKYKENFFVFMKDLKNIDNLIDEFWEENERYINYELLKNSNNKKVVISASGEFLLKKICKKISIDKLIATKIDKKTGKFNSKNCHDKEKLSRLNKEMKSFKIDNFYSDSYSDEILAKEANNAFIIENNQINDWNFNKSQRFFNKWVNILFFITFILILLICLFANGRNYKCKKVFLINNFGLLFFSIIFYFVIYKIINKIFKVNKVNKRVNYILLIISFVLVIILYIHSLNYFFIAGWDAWQVRESGKDIIINQKTNNIYFNNFNNNIFITYLISVIFKIGLHFRVNNLYKLLLLANCFIYSFTGFFLFENILILFNNLKKAIFGYITYFLVICLSPWIMIFYSDSVGLFLVTFGLYLYLIFKRNTSNIRWILLITFFIDMGIGYLIKPQIFILFIALFIYEVFNLKKDNIKKYFVSFLMFISVIITIVFLNNYITNNYFIVNKESRLGMPHYLMWGFNYKTRGVYSYEDLLYSLSFDNNKDRDKANLKVFKDRIDYLKLRGVLSLFIDKTLTTYNDGSFAYNNEGGFYFKYYKMGNAKIRKKLLDYYNGKHVRLFYTIKQFYWIGLLFFCCWSYKRRDSISYLKLAIIGLTIFELLFEARARYLITYVPIYIIIAIQGLDIILNYINSIKKKRNI